MIDNNFHIGDELTLFIAICDDLELDRKHIEGYIQDYNKLRSYDIKVITFHSGEELVEYYSEGNTDFDIIFLDIYMSGDNGIKVAQKIRELGSQCKIIFSTTSTDHALGSFSVFPFNYLVKPISKEVFNPVIEKALLSIDKEKQKSITIESKGQIHTIFYNDIKFLESNNRRININTVQGMITIYSKLDDVEIKINDQRFLRCHKSFLVNIDYVERIEDYSFILKESIKVPIKQRDFGIIKRKYYLYIINKAELNKFT